MSVPTRPLKQPTNAAEAGAWPEPVGTDNFERPVEVLITLEESEYQWLKRFVESEGGCTSFTPSFQRTVELLIRAARKEIAWEFVEELFAGEAEAES